MKISTLKIIWCYLTGGSSKVLDYVIDIANTAVNQLSEVNRERMAAFVATAKNILGTMASCSWMVPRKWETAYYLTISALADIVNACEKSALSREDVDACIAGWQAAYSAWRADD